MFRVIYHTERKDNQARAKKSQEDYANNLAGAAKKTVSTCVFWSLCTCNQRSHLLGGWHFCGVCLGLLFWRCCVDGVLFLFFSRLPSVKSPGTALCSDSFNHTKGTTQSRRVSDLMLVQNFNITLDESTYFFIPCTSQCVRILFSHIYLSTCNAVLGFSNQGRSYNSLTWGGQGWGRERDIQIN